MYTFKQFHYILLGSPVVPLTPLFFFWFWAPLKRNPSTRWLLGYDDM